MLTLTNAPILTTFGQFNYREMTVDEARELVRTRPWRSAVGHQSTAQVISEVLNIDCLVNRVTLRQAVGETFLVFAAIARLPEGVVYTRAQLAVIPFTWGLSTRTA